MQFEEFWSGLNSLLLGKRNFVTLHDNVAFEARNAIDAIRIDSETISTPRVIDKEEFIKIWRLSQDFPEEEKFHPGNYSKSSRHASYILTLFHEIMNS